MSTGPAPSLHQPPTKELPTELRIDVYHHLADDAERILHQLDAIDQRIAQLFSQGQHMTQQLDDLTREVAEEKTIMESATTLINGLADQIRALKDDPAALTALATDLDNSGNALAAAVAANTPAAPTP